jgi:hypothetical protein
VDELDTVATYRVLVAGGTLPKPAGIHVSEHERAALPTYREAATLPPLELTLRARLSAPILTLSIIAFWIGLAVLGACLEHDWNLAKAVSIGGFALVGVLLAFGSARGLLNRAVLSLSADTFAIRVSPLSGESIAPISLTSIERVEAVQLRHPLTDGSTVAIENSVRVFYQDGRQDVLLRFFGMTEAEAGYVAQCLQERLLHVRIGVPAETAMAAEDDIDEAPIGVARTAPK